MATVVQSKVKTLETGSSTYTFTLDSAATNDNYVLYFGNSASQVHSGACTFNSSNMTTDLDTQFGLMRVASFKVASGGTSLVVTLAGTSNFNNGIAVEVSGLASSSPLDTTTVYSATGEGSATSHSCEYGTGGANRIGFVYVMGTGGLTVTGANGATAIVVTSGGGGSAALVYKDNLGSSAGSIDFTVGSAGTFDFFGATYLTTGGGSGTTLAWIRA